MRLNEQPIPARFYRSPGQVMRVARMGCSHPTRLSFLRQLLRRLKKENWSFDRPVWQLNQRGYYTISGHPFRRLFTHTVT